MKTNSSWNFVIVLHLAFLLAGALVGMLVGGTMHPALGVTLGSFIGVNIPGLIGHLALKFGRSESPVMRLCGAIFVNDWIENEEMRTRIQDIRGENIIAWFGLFCAALLAVFAWHMGPSHCLATAVAGATAGWLFSKLS